MKVGQCEMNQTIASNTDQKTEMQLSGEETLKELNDLIAKVEEMVKRAKENTITQEAHLSVNYRKYVKEALKASNSHSPASLHSLWHELYRFQLAPTLKSASEQKQELLSIISSYEKILKELKLSIEGVS